MKRFACVCALAALLLLPAMAADASSLPWGSSFSSAQATDVPQQPGAESTEQPQGTGLRGMMPLLLMVGLYLLLRRTFRRRGGGQGPFPPQRDDGRTPPDHFEEGDPEHLKDAYDQARRAWDAFTSEPGKDVPAGEPRPVGYEPRSESGEDGPGEIAPEAETIDVSPADVQPTPAEQPQPEEVRPDARPQEPQDLPGDFDEDEFLKGARLVFERLVEAMDGLDPLLAANFAGPKVVNDIKYRLNQGHQPAQSEVVRVEAKIMERAVLQGEAFVTVYYDALKKVSGLGSVHLRQIWKFTKDDNDPAAMWMLESVEPVEA